MVYGSFFIFFLPYERLAKKTYSTVWETQLSLQSILITAESCKIPDCDTLMRQKSSQIVLCLLILESYLVL